MSEIAVQRALDLFDHASTGSARSIADLAYEEGLAATRRLERAEQKRLGQYMTPVPIARFMAQRAIVSLARDSIRILDPAAGSGVLGIAAVQAILGVAVPPKRIELLFCEIDVRLHAALASAGRQLHAQCAARGVMLDVQVHGGDFLLSDLALSQQPCVDLVIANPPYFKLGKADPRALAHAFAVHGQPNIYGLFMAACASLVRPGGVWCFITPRSWTGGDYFGAVRRHVLTRLHLIAVHVFESRSEHFGDDEVLQEAVIAWARAGVASAQVEVGSSSGVSDLHRAAPRRLPVDQVLRRADSFRVCLPHAPAGIECLQQSLKAIGLRVFTGPVVAFRAKRWLRAEAGEATVALL